MTRRCDDLEPLHSAWVDGELGPVERARLASHLQRCTRCRAAVHGLRVTQTMLRSLPQRSLPAGVGAVEGTAPRRRVSGVAVRRVATRSTTVAFVLAVILGAAGFVAGSTSPTQPSVQVPVDIYVADHLVRSVGGPVSTPALVEGKP